MQVNPFLLTEEQKQLMAAAQSSPVGAAPTPPPTPVVTQQQAAAAQPMMAADLLAKYAQPQEFKAPKNLREGVSNAFNNLVLTPIQQALFLKESPTAQFNRLRSNQARLDYATSVQNLTREGQARALAMDVDLANYPAQIQLAYLAKSRTDPAGAFDVLSTYDNRFATDKTKNFSFRENLPDEKKKVFDEQVLLARSQTNINTAANQAGTRALDSFYKQGDAYRDAYNTAIRTGDAAQQMMDLLNSGTETGFGAETLMQARKIGQALGIEVEGTTGEEAFQSLSVGLVLPLVKQLGVNPTDKDLDFVVKGTAALDKSPAANRLMLRTLQFQNKRAQILYKASLEFQEKDAFGEQLQKTNPIAFNLRYEQHMMEAQNSPDLLREVQSLRAEYNRLTKGANTAQTGAGAAAANALVN